MNDKIYHVWWMSDDFANLSISTSEVVERQLFRAWFWDVFKPYKCRVLIESINSGKSWAYSYEKAKNTKRK